jgi:hypothetical protein
LNGGFIHNIHKKTNTIYYIFIIIFILNNHKYVIFNVSIFCVWNTTFLFVILVVPTSEFFFGDKMKEGLTLVGAFPKGTTVTGWERDSVAKTKFTSAHNFVKKHSVLKMNDSSFMYSTYCGGLRNGHIIRIKHRQLLN